MKRLLLIVLCSLCWASIYAQKKVISSSYSLHKIASKETWYSISRQYGISVEDLQNLNNGITSLKVGETIKVPGSKANASETVVVEKQTKSAEAKRHVVAQGENLYRISKNFGVTTSQLKEWNELSSESVKVGQELIVSSPGDYKPTANRNSTKPGTTKAQPELNGQPSTKATQKLNQIEDESAAKLVDNMLNKGAKSSSPKGTTVTLQQLDAEMNSMRKAQAQVQNKVAQQENKGSQADQILNPNGTSEKPAIDPVAVATNGMKEVTESGTAAWINDEDMNPSKFYALHRTAKVGTIIKVTYPLSNQSIYAKVVGVLPDTPDNEGVIIKISKVAGAKLGVGESKFQAELSYGVIQ